MVFDALTKRRKEPSPRVHSELTDSSRERLANITNFAGPALVDGAIDRLGNDVAQSSISPYLQEGSTSRRHRYFVLKADTEYVFSYIEYLLYFAYEGSDKIGIQRYSKEQVVDAIVQIAEMLREEGILWELKPAESGVRFEEIASESMAESDQELRSLAFGSDWEEAMHGYDDAYRLYKEGIYGKEIPEKLYNSIEETVKKICVEKAGWTGNDEMRLQEYINLLREHDVFQPNNIMAPELEDLVSSMERMFAKTGKERNHAHKYLDRQYCTLLLHQTSAWLFFLIKRYKQTQ